MGWEKNLCPLGPLFGEMFYTVKHSDGSHIQVGYDFWTGNISQSKKAKLAKEYKVKEKKTFMYELVLKGKFKR